MSYKPDANWYDFNDIRDGVLSISAQLLKAQAAAGNGPWVDCRAMKQMTLHVQGTFVGTVQLYGSNDSSPTGPIDNGIAIGSAITAPGLVQFSGPYRFIRAVVTPYTSGSINAFLHGIA